jgi:uncharacterized protein
MTRAATKRCVVAYATTARQYLWTVELAPEASIADALAAARGLAPALDVPWDSAPVGIFGELRARSDVPEEADRIEIYRPLPQDPREVRRERVQLARKAARRR